MLLLKREDIKKVLTMRETVECVKQAFRMVSEGSCEIPLRTNIQAPAHDGCFLFMPAYAAGIDAAALKVINLFPRNTQKGMPTSFAQFFLMDGTNGTISAVLDGDCITQMRTGAASGAAFDLLGRKDSRIGAVIGTGGQAPTQIEGMLAVRKLEEVRVFDLDAERTRTFAERMQRELAGYGARIVAAPTSDAAVGEEGHQDTHPVLYRHIKDVLNRLLI